MTKSSRCVKSKRALLGRRAISKVTDFYNILLYDLA